MRRNTVVLALTFVSFALFVTGCSEPVPPPEVSEDIAIQQREKEEQAAQAAAERESAEDEYEIKKAGVGATGKGQYGVTSEQPMSIVTTPVSTYFFAQEKTVFDMQIPQALSLFQASEGRYPNSHEEFMQKIIQANQIVLPKLPEGDSYIYDVPSHTLMIQTLKAKRNSEG